LSGFYRARICVVVVVVVVAVGLGVVRAVSVVIGVITVIVENDDGGL
jgi:hypothetical protein